ncbi:hypothetical protein [Massilia timonae]|uniref:hypothetical protein n=1 Tax=Massilia timonae TaxID=47229 RepID=UPI0028D531FB|nr:hypothetical protein [Massilia timonae]
MASIQCPGCKAHITVPGLINCPRCQTFMDPPFLRERAAAEAAATARVRGPGLGPKEWLGLVSLGAIIILAGLIVYRVAIPSASQVHDRAVSAALLACQQRIAGLAEFGGAEMPPYSKNWGKGDEFYFAWQRGSFHFKNGFGASVPMSASCVGTVSTQTIKS